MKYTKMKGIKIIALAFILVLTMQNIIAFGVTPGRTTVMYNDADKEFFFTVLNSGEKDMDLSFSTAGDLGKYIILDEKQAIISSDEESKMFRFTLDIGKEFEIPGVYNGKIIITENTKNEKGVGVSLSVSTQVALKVTEASIELRKTSYSVKQERNLQKTMQDIAFNAVLLLVFLISLTLLIKRMIIKRKK